MIAWFKCWQLCWCAPPYYSCYNGLHNQNCLYLYFNQVSSSLKGLKYIIRQLSYKDHITKWSSWLLYVWVISLPTHLCVLRLSDVHTLFKSLVYNVHYCWLFESSPFVNLYKRGDPLFQNVGSILSTCIRKYNIVGFAVVMLSGGTL